MPPSSWSQVRELFERAVELLPDERHAFLAASGCADDVRREVEELLLADREPDPGDVAIERDLYDADTSPIGTRIGRYEVQRVLGTGGMSTVFEAVQDQPRRTVAVKTMRFGLLSEAARRRFEYESEVLGRLRHPAIAQVYEVGTWREPLSGQDVPFFAMEFVDGARPLLDHIEENALRLEAALELYLRVLDAVWYGHQLGVIHRDLKPANILVDRRGQPKVIDFGIARAAEGGDRTLQTRTGQVLGTLPYMAPEQLDGVPDAVDHRADVYALGVVLYELLAGRPPHDPEGRPITAFAREVRERPVPAPSSSQRGYASIGFSRELDWIARAAIAPDKGERYASVSELAADIRRFLANQPVSVGPPSTAYVLRTFVRRNKVLVFGVAAVVLALVLGVVGTTWQMLRAQDMAEQARRQARRAERTNDFLNEILKFGTPEEGRYRARPDMTIGEALAEAAARLDELKEEPDVEADVRVQLAEAFRSSGELDEAERQLRRAAELRRELLGDAHPDVAACLRGLALVASARGEPEAALVLHREALDMFRVAGAHRDVALCHTNIGASLADLERYEEGEAELRKGIELCRAAPEDLERFVASGLRILASLLREKGDADAAIATYREAIASFERAGKAWHPYAGRARRELASLLRERDGFEAEAEALLRDALRIAIDAYGEPSREVCAVRWSLGLMLKDAGRFADAGAEMRRVEPHVDEHNPGDAGFPEHLRFNLLLVLRHQEKYAEALPLARVLHEGAVARHRWEDPENTYLTGVYARSLRDAGELEEAERVFRQLLDLAERKGTAARRLLARTDVAVVLTRQDRFDEARPMFEELLPEAPSLLNEGHHLLGALHLGYGECLHAAREYAAAEEHLRRAVEVYEPRVSAAKVPLRRVLRALVRLYEDWDRPAARGEIEARLAALGSG